MRRLADFKRTAAWRAARQGGFWAAALACALAIAACSGDSADEPELSTFTGDPISAEPQAAVDAQDAAAPDADIPPPAALASLPSISTLVA